MANQRLAPDAILSQIALSGSVANIQDDPDSPNLSWLTWDGVTNSDTSARVSFPSPSGNLITGAGLQEFRALLRVNLVGGNSCTVDLVLYESGLAVATLATGISVTSITGQIVAVNWNASLLAGISGTNVELQVQQTSGGSGGNPSNRRRVEIGAVEWNAEYSTITNSRTQISWAELETPDIPPRRLQISWSEVETPDIPTRSMQLSWAELETPAPPSRVQFSWAELETGEPPRRVQLSWAELETPSALSRAQISWAELETPDAPSRAVVLSWTELETPDIPSRKLVVSWAEIEIPSLPARRLDVSWAEFETPNAGERCVQISWAGFECTEHCRHRDSWFVFRVDGGSFISLGEFDSEEAAFKFAHDNPPAFVTATIKHFYKPQE